MEMPGRLRRGPCLTSIVLLAMKILLGGGWSGVIFYSVLRAELLDCDCREAAGGGDAAGDQHCGGYAHWTHGIFLTRESLIAIRLLSAGLGSSANAFVHRGPPSLVHSALSSYSSWPRPQTPVSFHPLVSRAG